MSEYDIIIFYIRYIVDTTNFNEATQSDYQGVKTKPYKSTKANYSSDFTIYSPNIRSLKINSKTEPCYVKYLHTYHFNNSLICLLIPMGNQYHFDALR